MSAARIIIPLIGLAVGVLVHYLFNTNELETPPNRPRGDEDDRRSLTEIRCQKTCAICQERTVGVDGGSNVKALPCKHEFHRSCIEKWRRENNTCPLCRRGF